MRQVLTVLLLTSFFAVFGITGAGITLTSATAQEIQQAPVYENWESVALRAESVTQAGRASNTALEGLRQELVVWRQIFLAAQDINQARISTLKNQITAIGPAPENHGV